MTLLAACFIVFSEQAETGIHIVAKCQFVPGAFFMTTFATLPEATLMLIVLTVTTLAVTRSICVALVNMTLIAEYYFVCATEHELGFCMIEARVIPVVLIMAIATPVAKVSPVQIYLAMTR